MIPNGHGSSNGWNGSGLSPPLQASPIASISQALQALEKTQQDLNQIRDFLNSLLSAQQQSRDSWNFNSTRETHSSRTSASPSLNNSRPLPSQANGFISRSATSSPRLSYFNQLPTSPSTPLSPLRSPRFPLGYISSPPSPRSPALPLPTPHQSQRRPRSANSSQFLDSESSSGSTATTPRADTAGRSLSEMKVRSDESSAITSHEKKDTNDSFQDGISSIPRKTPDSAIGLNLGNSNASSVAMEEKLTPKVSALRSPTSSTRKSPPSPLNLNSYSQIIRSVARDEEPSAQLLESGGLRVERSSGKGNRLLDLYSSDSGISEGSNGSSESVTNSPERWLEEEDDYELSEQEPSTPTLEALLEHDYTELSIIHEEHSNLSRDSSAIAERNRDFRRTSKSLKLLTEPGFDSDQQSPSQSIDTVTNGLRSLIDSHQGLEEESIKDEQRNSSQNPTRMQLGNLTFGSEVGENLNLRMPGGLTALSRDSPPSSLRSSSSARASSTSSYHTSFDDSKDSDSEDSFGSPRTHQVTEMKESTAGASVQKKALTNAEELEWKAVVGSVQTMRMAQASEKENFIRRPSAPLITSTAPSITREEKMPRRASCSSDYPATSSHDTTPSSFPSMTNINEKTQVRRGSNNSPSEGSLRSHSRQGSGMSKEMWIIDTNDSEEVPNQLLKRIKREKSSPVPERASSSDWLGGLDAEDDSSMSDIGGRGTREELSKISDTFKQFEFENPKSKSSSGTVRSTTSSKSSHQLRSRVNSVPKTIDSNNSQSQSTTTPTSSILNSPRSGGNGGSITKSPSSPSLDQRPTQALRFSSPSSQRSVSQDLSHEGLHGGGFCLNKTSFRTPSPLGRRSFSPGPDASLQAFNRKEGNDSAQMGRHGRRSTGDGPRSGADGSISPSPRRSWIVRALRASEDGPGPNISEEMRYQDEEPKETFIDTLFGRSRSPTSRSATPLSTRSRRASSSSLGKIKKFFVSPDKKSLPQAQLATPQNTTRKTPSPIFFIGRDQSKKESPFTGDVSPAPTKDASSTVGSTSAGKSPEKPALQHSRSFSNIVSKSKSFFDSSGRKTPTDGKSKVRPSLRETSSASPILSADPLPHSVPGKVEIADFREVQRQIHSSYDRNQVLDNLYSHLLSETQASGLSTPLTPPARKRRLHLENSPEPPKIELPSEASSTLFPFDFENVTTRSSTNSFVQPNEFAF